MTQYGFPIRNKLNIVKSDVQLFIGIIAFATGKRKQSRNPVSVKFPFDIKTIRCQYVIPDWCCHHIKQICRKICTRWFEWLQIRKPIGEKPNACQLMRNNESEIIIGSDVTQFDPCNMVLGIHRCLSINARWQVWVIQVVNGITVWLYTFIIEICEWLVLKQWVKKFSRVILIRS